MRSRTPSVAASQGGRLRPVAVVFGVVFGWHAAAAAGYLIWALTLPAHNPDGRCEGIGWGCTLPPRDAALLLGAFVGVPLVLVSMAIATAIGIWIALRRRTTPVRAGTVATFVAVPVTAVGASVLYVTSPF
jgi:hypothetical protein